MKCKNEMQITLPHPTMRNGIMMLITQVNYIITHFLLDYPNWTHRLIPDLIYQVLPNPNFLNMVRSPCRSISIIISMLQEFKAPRLYMTPLMTKITSERV